MHGEHAKAMCSNGVIAREHTADHICPKKSFSDLSYLSFSCQCSRLLHIVPATHPILIFLVGRESVHPPTRHVEYQIYSSRLVPCHEGRKVESLRWLCACR